MAEKIKLKSHSDTRGILTVLDNEIKFKIKRVYFIYNVKKTRGGHRHKKNIQALIAIKGKCTVFVDNSKIKKNFVLNKKNQCLILEPKDWHIMKNFSKDCILLVLCSNKYEKSDYIAEPYKKKND